MSAYENIAKVRTLGDGMENALFLESPELNKTTSKYKDLNINLQQTNSILKSLKPVLPKSEKFYLVPKYTPKDHVLPTKFSFKKPKEPKFVPYEPYKAAVEPIIKPKHDKPLIEMKPNRNNVEIQKLVKEMSEFRAIEMNKATLTAIKSAEALIPKEQWNQEKEAYETDIKNLRETNAHLENQLKFQAKVNSELKTLLVAAVGEDLETRVQHLTEDKLQLARALLSSANHLTSNQEQTEWLSGQCEVWRSKFLASSLMVEELARWKSALTQRISEYQEACKSILEERVKLNKNLLQTRDNLETISRSIAKNETYHEFHTLKNSNNLQLSSSNNKLSSNICKQLNLAVGSNCITDSKCRHYTHPENIIHKMLQNPVTISNKQDAICNAVLGVATSLTGQQMFLQHPSIHVSCCSHCKGEVQNI